MTTEPTKILAGATDADMRDILVEMYNGNVGRSLTEYETGIVCKRLALYGMAPDEIASKLKLSVKQVEETLSRVDSYKGIRDRVRAEMLVSDLPKAGDQ